MEGKSRGDKNNSSSLVQSQKDALSKGEVSKFSINYMINIQLVKGTPLVFLDFTQNFFNMIEARIEMQRLRML